jgi:hypothetical protein
VLLQATVDAERERTRALATKDDVRRVEDRINFLIQELINDRSPR